MDAPAPWVLSGRGFILMYRFPAAFVRDSCFLPDEWKESKWSGIGYVMLVDYQSSPVGSYRELLIIPGKTRFGGVKLATISKIYVDSCESMINGRINWGIPKELTDFTWTEENRLHTIQVGSNKPWFQLVLETGSIPFPVNTKLLPIHLYQELDEKKFLINPSGKGTGHFTLIKYAKADSAFFPDLDQVEPLVAIYVNPFRLTFPVANVEAMNGD
ncbi:MAG: acetoacetate decarboxylase family protein [Bacteroidales bacterium]